MVFVGFMLRLIIFYQSMTVIGYNRNELTSKLTVYPLFYMVVKHGIWIVKSIGVLMSYGIILSVRYLVAVSCFLSSVLLPNFARLCPT